MKIKERLKKAQTLLKGMLSGEISIEEAFALLTPISIDLSGKISKMPVEAKLLTNTLGIPTDAEFEFKITTVRSEEKDWIGLLIREKSKS